MSYKFLHLLDKAHGNETLVEQTVECFFCNKKIQYPSEAYLDLISDVIGCEYFCKPKCIEAEKHFFKMKENHLT